MSRGLMRMVLEYDACTCLEAGDGDAALAVLNTQKIDLMILDLIMPRVTGMDVLKVLRQGKMALDPRVIIVSGMLDPETRNRAEQLGAHAILEKPYDMGELRTLVSNLCSVKPADVREHSFSPP